MMKKAFSLVAIAAFMLTVSCDKKEAKITFPEKEFNFGTINEGEKVTHIFTFKNEGTADLLITDAKGSCGCTVPEYPKEAIKPGEESSIKVSFNSAHKHGKQQKTVTLVTNSKKKVEILNIIADVTPAAVSGISASVPAITPSQKTPITK
ncbi:MAG: DUF1573 domain-containing protein [Flavobacterium sp.]|nr:DUF1573 domain-containing protein [Flavobacterium sp.]